MPWQPMERARSWACRRTTTRDFEFAMKYNIPIEVVIAPPDYDGEPLQEAYIQPGVMVNSGPFTGLPNEDGKAAVARHLEENGLGRADSVLSDA